MFPSRMKNTYLQSSSVLWLSAGIHTTTKNLCSKTLMYKDKELRGRRPGVLFESLPYFRASNNAGGLRFTNWMMI